MTPNEYRQFTDAWSSANEVMPGGKQLSTAGMKMVLDALKHYPLNHLLAALAKHVQTARFAPTPADIISLIQAHTNTGHIGSDEAWSIAEQSIDEAVTSVLTQEIIEARGVALPVWLSGDKIGARMAFKEAYSRLIKTAGPPVWFVSEGTDKTIKTDAINRAIELGRLTQERAAKYLPAPLDGGVIGKLLTGKAVDEAESGVDEAEAEYRREVIRRMRGIINAEFKKAEEKENLKQQQKQLESEKKREEFEQKRQQALEQIKNLQLTY